MVDQKQLGETQSKDELVPGNPEALFQNAQTLRDRAVDILADGEALKRIDTGAWTGPAHDAYADENANQAPKWSKTGDALGYGAQAVEAYAHCLSWAKLQAQQALEMYAHGVELSRQAQQQAQQAPQPQPAPANDPGQEFQQAAHDTLNRAREQLRQMGAECAKSLNDLAGAAPNESDDESTVSAIGHGVLDVLGFAPFIGDAGDLVNSGWYALQGKGVEAAASAFGALPFVGWGVGAGKAGKDVGKIYKAIEEGGDASRAARFGEAVRKDYRATFRQAFPETEGKVEVHHAVEQQAAKLYPHLDIDWTKMHSVDNLRGIPYDEAGDLHRGFIRDAWDDFYQANPKPTEQEVLDHVTWIDDQVGHRMSPQVREPPK